MPRSGSRPHPAPLTTPLPSRLQRLQQLWSSGSHAAFFITLLERISKSKFSRHCFKCCADIAADKHGEYVSCLGNTHTETALIKVECPHCKDLSCLSVLAVSFLFRNLFGKSSGAEELSARRQGSPRRLSPRVPHFLLIERFLAPSSLTLSASL